MTTTKSRKRKRKCKATWKPLSGWKPLTSQRSARKITSDFHNLTREIEQLKGKLAADGLTKDKKKQLTEEIVAVERQLNEMGGRDKYQQASILLTDINKSSSKWVFKVVTKLGMRPKSNEPPLKTLEVGAINTQLLSCPWLDVTAIDIKSQNPRIKEVDFFKYPVIDGELDLLVNAMVINCVPTPLQRGEMLLRCHRHLKPGGKLFMVLPLRCVTESPFLNNARFESLLKQVGFEKVEYDQSPKIAFYCFSKVDVQGEDLDKRAQALGRMFPDPPRRKVRPSKPGQRLGNDFAISFDKHGCE